MNIWLLLMSFVAGAATGAGFLAALWWTTQRLPYSHSPARLLAGSLLARMTLVLGVFLLLSRFGRWELMAAGLGGFIVVRMVTVGRVKAATGKD